ncbi:MAG: ATP-dependent sacrificial sulfur transferase LarE [Candidatus Omnitrophica bacterium]|nr:ATP-dependent sacrificial sulfur transferase LarE [Candidatus Omnitrophota bacterium]
MASTCLAEAGSTKCLDKIKRLEKVLGKMDSVVVAFSGGVDSSFLLKVARDTLSKEKVLAVTAVSDTYMKRELAQAKKFARSLGIRHKIIYTNEMGDKKFIKNPKNRCYYCKKELFVKLKNMAKGIVVDASNVDDKSDYRPGSKAKKELGVRSPLQEAGITKQEIRRFSKKRGLKTWNFPPMPCLASRIPYGERISKLTLQRIEKAENFIRVLGVDLVRVRYHNDTARLEVEKKDVKRFFNQRFCDKIVRRLKKLGFSYIALDLEGYRTGSLNEVLK